MHWVLSKVEKIEQSSSGLNEGNRRCPVGKIHIDNESKEDPAHVGMLFSSKTGKRCDPLCEQSDAEVGREALTSGVEFFLAEGSCNPGYEVFHNSLVQLMEDIGG